MCGSGPRLKSPETLQGAPRTPTDRVVVEEREEEKAPGLVECQEVKEEVLGVGPEVLEDIYFPLLHSTPTPRRPLGVETEGPRSVLFPFRDE